MHNENIVSNMANIKAEVYMRAIDRYNVLGTDENPYIENDRRYILFEFIKRAILQWLPPPTGKSIWNMYTDPISNMEIVNSINYPINLRERYYVPEGVSKDILHACLYNRKGDMR